MSEFSMKDYNRFLAAERGLDLMYSPYGAGTGGCEICDGDHDTMSHELDPYDFEDPNLTGRQQMLEDALEAVTERFGKFNTGKGPDGAHYMDAAANPFPDLNCANCTFYKGGGLCEIVEGPQGGRVDPGAVCKLWIIPGDLIQEDTQLSVLTTKARNALPDSAFVFPEKKAYPIHDLAHARAALSMVAQHGTPEERAKVTAAVHKRYPELAKD